MFFTPKFKRKRNVSSNWHILKSFPIIESGRKFEGIFTGMSVEVCAKEDVISLYENGFYGKGSQSRSAPQVVLNMNSSKPQSESLSLSLEEAFFLAFYINVLKINDIEGTEIKYQCFLQDCVKANEFFIESLASYLYLKSKGWIVKSGLKFGGNYLIYRRGPRFYHASFVVIVSTPSRKNYLDSKNFKGLQRIAEASDKDVLILQVHVPSDFNLPHINAISSVQISEMVIRRFNCASYVQNKNTML